MKVGFIGLGKMGRPMAQNILKKGFSLTVHNRSRGVVEYLAKMGAKAATSPAEVAKTCDIVLTSLPNTQAVEEVYLGQDGLIPAARPGQVFADLSTIGPSTARKLYETAKTGEASFLDAPVSGGVAGAEAAILTIMVGGDGEALKKVYPVFEALGKNIHHVGPTGAGCVIKLVNQLLVAINMAGVAEAMVLGAKAGADPRVMLEVLNTSFGQSRMLSRAGPLILNREFEPKTTINLIIKDLGLIQDLGAELSLRLLMGTIAKQVFAEARAAGFGENDMAALVRPLEQLSRVEVRG
ncbi:MAG: NAD(P)-dependent oxidoreductase [Chloroflexi bacterium]|nr:NAD(P)-dependent oxidoreductase [Chloroflexota bacterium]